MMSPATAASLVATGSVSRLGCWPPRRPPSAAARNGSCQSGEFCLYYNSERRGPLVDLVALPAHLRHRPRLHLVRVAPAAGRAVRQEQHRLGLEPHRQPVFVFYSSDFGGAYGIVPADTKV